MKGGRERRKLPVHWKHDAAAAAAAVNKNYIMGATERMLDQVFNLKFLSKQLVRQAKKCEKDRKAERNKVAEEKKKKNHHHHKKKKSSCLGWMLVHCV